MRRKEKLINFIASGFYISYIPSSFNSFKKFTGAGLFGTLLALALSPLLPEKTIVLSIFLLFFYFFSVLISDRAFAEKGEEDNPLIVIDEIFGYWLSLVFVKRDLKQLLTAFVLFRIFDTLKPWPIKKTEKIFPGGWGIVNDDLIAGIYAGILTLAAAKFI